jgi:hypothetical protein
MNMVEATVMSAASAIVSDRPPIAHLKFFGLMVRSHEAPEYTRLHVLPVQMLSEGVSLSKRRESFSDLMLFTSVGLKFPSWLYQASANLVMPQLIAVGD